MTDPSRDVLFLSATRTPIGRFQGGLSTLSGVSLGAAAIRSAVERANLPDPAEIAEILIGNVVQAGTGQGPARQAGIQAGLPVSVGAVTVNKVCGSGMKAMMCASQAIRLGDADLYVVGGMESMSQAPFLVNGRMGELRYGHSQLTDALMHDGLWDPFENWTMGEAAEFIAEAYKISREEMDEFAFNSHQKAIRAVDGGLFQAEIAPVEVPGRKGTTTIFDVDETPRRDTTLEALARLRPAFASNGKVTAGNSPGLSDGASALVLASRAKAQEIGQAGLAKLVGHAQAAVEPKWLFDAPSRVMPVLLKKIGWSLADVDLIELNEAFAAQALANGKALADLGWNWDKVNVNGGAIALGHPIGATGARIVCTLIHALRGRGLRRGIALLCMGGAEATAVAVEVE